MIDDFISIFIILYRLLTLMPEPIDVRGGPPPDYSNSLRYCLVTALPKYSRHAHINLLLSHGYFERSRCEITQICLLSSKQ